MILLAMVISYVVVTRVGIYGNNDDCNNETIDGRDIVFLDMVEPDIVIKRMVIRDMAMEWY